MSSSKRTASESAVDRSKPRQKRYHRRAVWACDECRLRKIKCDGGEPCRHCIDITRDCSYAGRVRPSLPPTQRIRALEDTLRAVRAALDDVRRTTAPPADGYDHVIALLDGATPGSSAPEDTPRSSGWAPTPIPVQTSTSAPAPDTTPTLPTPRWRQRLPKAWGYTSGFSVIRRLASLFKGADIPRHAVASIEELFDTPSPTDQEPIKLPDDVTILDLFDAGLERSCPAHHICSVSELRSLLDNKHDPPVKALLHAASALGYLANHPYRNCEPASATAWRHSSAAEQLLDLSQCDEVISLQTLLCLVRFSLNTCHLWRAHNYSSIAVSWVSQLGFHTRANHVQQENGHDEVAHSYLGIVTHDLHSYLCSTLGIPLGGDRFALMESSGVSGDRRWSASSPLSRGQDELTTPLSTLRFQITEIARIGLETVFERPIDSLDHERINLHRLGSVEGVLQDLAEQSFSSIAHALSPRQAPRRKAELELTAYACQLKLYMPFLQYLVGMANGSFTTRTRSQRVLACIKTASKTISLCDSLMRQDLLEPSSWFQTYTLFLAVLTLVYLIAAHKGTTQPSQAWAKGEMGIRILAAMRCGDNAATKSLRCIRLLVEQLSHTVEFNVDDIEKSTPTLCGSQHKVYISSPHDRRPTIAAILNSNAQGTTVSSPTQGRAQISTADDILAKADDFVLFAAGDDYRFETI